MEKNTKFKEQKFSRSRKYVLTAPLTKEELAAEATKAGRISINVFVSFEELVDNDIEWLNDTVSELITDDIGGLTDLNYKVAGRDANNNVLVNVNADVSNFLNEDNE